MKGQLKIEKLYAFIVLDDDGTEGVPAFANGAMLIPCMGADVARIDQVQRIIKGDPFLKGKKITLALFSQREDIETFTG